MENWLGYFMAFFMGQMGAYWLAIHQPLSLVLGKGIIVATEYLCRLSLFTVWQETKKAYQFCRGESTKIIESTQVISEDQVVGQIVRELTEKVHEAQQETPSLEIPSLETLPVRSMKLPAHHLLAPKYQKKL